MFQKILGSGSLSISEDVFSIISSIVIDEMDEICGKVSHLKDDFIRILNKKGNQKGIIIDNLSGKVMIDVKISIFLGYNIYDICVRLQQRIKEEIEALTGVRVAAVNVIVASVQIKT